MESIAPRSVRPVDWRFLLPSPEGGVFEHLVLLGGTAEAEASLRELGVARRISRQLHGGDRADAVIILADAAASIDQAAAQLGDDGVLYWEIDRRTPAGMALSPARAARQLRRHGIRTERTYWVKPGFPRREMYIPLDAPGAIRWYFDTLFRPLGAARRLLRTMLLALGARGWGLAAVAPCFALIAARGPSRQPALMAHAARMGAPVNDAQSAVVVAQGDYDWNRIALLLFEAGAASPVAAIKIPRRPLYNGHIEWEHHCLTELASAVPPAVKRSLPASRLFAWNDLAVSVQHCVPGPNLHSRVASGSPDAFDDLRRAADWLAAFHASTSDAAPGGGRAWLRERLEAQIAEYRSVYGATPEEHALFASVLRDLDHPTAGVVPLVWQHADFGPWNLYREGDHISVIDWETARRGPAVTDLLYLVTHWSFEFTGCDSEDDRCRQLRRLFCDPAAADPLTRDLRRLVADYVRQVDVAPALLPTLLVYTLVEQALDRMRRLRTTHGAKASDRAANGYVGYLGVLAANADGWFARPAIAQTAARAHITVAVATRNRPAQLARCVEAILSGGTLPAEVVIVDQSDDSRTAELVAGATWSHILPVHYVRAASRGLAASRNAAAARATSPVVAFTDDDCVPDSGWLTAVAAAFDGPDNVDAVTGRILPLGPERPGFYAVSTRDSRIRSLYNGRALPWVVGSGGNSAVTRTWLQRVGGFDERLGTGTPGRAAEDVDLLYRLLRGGATVCYEPEAVVFHERQDAARQLATRPSYGFGMGAFCAMWARRRDAYAIWMFGRWCVDRARRLAGGCVRRRWRRVREELLMLGGAWKGLRYGFGVRVQQ